MIFKFNLKNLKNSREKLLFVLDFLMLALVIFNINWIIFETLFTSILLQNFLMSLHPEATLYYKNTIHPNFPTYDMVFVAIFITELLFRWAVSISRKTYHRWFFYPFIHWYDVLGCIPIGSFRWLRLLRIISILYRLEKYQIFDFSKSYPARVLKKYVDILVEEVSDRVVVNVLKGVQDEINSGNPIVEKVSKEVLLPQKQLLADWLAGRINDLADTVYQPRKEEFQQYLDKIISESLAQAPKLKMLDKIPMVGGTLTEIVENTVSTVVFNVTDKLISDIGHKDTDLLVRELTDLVIERLTQHTGQLNQAIKDILIESIDVIKDEVAIQQWKLKEQQLGSPKGSSPTTSGNIS